jgi:D-beta-D-heptose 7-phosphate kinase/D-beta-D-heptose 1-phosphate adenosyltransferase
MFKTILVTGVFDILHREHIRLLNEAKKIGDILIVGVESDVRVKKIKGLDRPINNQKQRVENLHKIGLADDIFVLPEKFSTPEDHRLLLQMVRPDILAVSAHTAFLEEKRKLMAEIGGEVRVVLPHNPNVSTTKELIKLKNNTELHQSNKQVTE